MEMPAIAFIRCLGSTDAELRISPQAKRLQVKINLFPQNTKIPYTPSQEEGNQTHKVEYL